MASQATAVTDLSTRRRALVAGSVGNFMEWFDYAVYAYLASVIGGLFFPSDVPYTSTLATFAVFAVGFFMRPLGGFIFGHFGDKFGRRWALSASIMLMAFATVSIGLLPTAAQIGVLAPILLVVARLVQGLSIGGEYGGSAAFMVEYAPDHRRGYYGSWVSASIGAGFLAGSLLATLMTTLLPEDALNSWGWRLPFIAGMLVGVVGLYIRLRIDDTPAFRAVEQEREVEGAPLRESFLSYWKQGLIAIGFTLVYTVAYYSFLTYMPTYLSEVIKLPLSQALTASSLGLALHVVALPFLGLLSDRVGRKPLLIGASVGIAALTYPAFLMMSGGDFLLIVLAQLLFGFLVALYAAPAATALVEMFPTKVRASALGVSYNLAVATFGGTAPFVATFLVSRTGSNLAPALYVSAAGIITALVLIFAVRETYKEDLQ